MENRQVFVVVPTLGELRYLLAIIVEEITTYQVWPVGSFYWEWSRLLLKHLMGTLRPIAGSSVP
jgi:hypothetical protein